MKKKLFCALWTPTDKEGKLLKKEIREHLRFLAARKVDGILACGSTGQFLNLDLSTRKELLETVLENKGSLEVLFNISHTEPKGVIDLARFARSLPLAGVLLLPPLYYPISQPDLAAYFIQMAAHINHPLYLYNYPERTNVPIGIETLEAVSREVTLAGIKLSGGNLAHFKAVVDWGRGKTFIPYSGNDLQLPETLRLGAQGSIGGLVNAIPEISAQILEADRRGENLAPWEAKLGLLGKSLSRLSSPWNVAALMEARNLTVGAPKMPLSEETCRQYESLVGELRSLMDSWIH